MAIPTKEEAVEILKKYNEWESVHIHSLSVADYCLELIGVLEEKGHEVDKQLVISAAILHDISKMYSRDHVHDGADLLEHLGYHEVAVITRQHGLKDFKRFPPDTIESKIVFYADKRDEWGEIVSLEERFECLKKRYGPKLDWDECYEFAKKIGEELMG